MSLVLLAAAGGVGLYFLSQRPDDDATGNPPVAKDTDDTAKNITAGKYGTIAELGEIADMPYVFVREEKDTDLTGVPFRWLVTQTGRRYKTYNMIHPSAQMALPDSYWDSEEQKYSHMSDGGKTQIAKLEDFRRGEAARVHKAFETLRNLPS